ncbi:hypothetical protein CAPTEDRAFT_163453 [Capitella teleta]|uniref:Nucleosome assembly protein 1-like 1 n=1 Tax=Capitella teleta TaxID=283909 RepID=R7VK07_CAPTE|nr:hypothetical protein CAPTEDRAFT_163453 [Capitella teleta]|eukprot:ELU16365.1 hypothetical protein CAPTEDRAFT_163453 [Capitella teleta]
MADQDKVETNVEEIDEEEIEEIDTGAEDDVTSAGALTASLMQSPEVLAALQSQLGSMVGVPSGYIQSLPKVVKRRLKALKKLQFEMIKIESKFYEEVHDLECKYAAQYQPLYERRKEVLSGNVEPTDDDCDWPSEDEDEDEEEDISGDLQNKVKIEEVDETGAAKKPEEKVDGEKEEKKEEKKDDENVTGVPEFWLTVFKNVDMLNDMVQEHDEPILKHLNDIKVKFSKADPMGFSLEFHFEPNEFFTNSVLTKEYEMRTEADQDDPFSYEGPEIIKCKGCTIDWKKGKNVTVKLIKKTQKHKNRGTKRTITKTVQNDSFFNFFTPPDVPEGDEEADEDTEALLAADFEIGHFIRERIVPRAVLYFTGEALEEDDFDDEEGDDDDEDDEDYNEDEDADFAPGQGHAKQDQCKQQ